MATSFPGGIDSFPAVSGTMDTAPTHSQRHTDLQDAVAAIETELGTSPAGASATVKARIEAIEANDWVTSARIAANAVGSSELADNAVDTAAIADGAVTTAKIGNGQVQNANLGDGAVTSRTLATGAVNSAAIEDATIVNGDIATNAAIAASKISGTALVASTADAKGDLYVATAADTVARLAVGANNTILTADSTATPGVKWATPTTRVGTGSPLSVVVPDFKGQRYIDTDQTLGAREWVATTTLSSGWVVSDGLTPTYDVRTLLTSPWTTAGVAQLWRDGRRVHLRLTSVKGGAALSDPIITLPAGFRVSAFASLLTTWYDDQATGLPLWTLGGASSTSINFTGGMFDKSAWTTSRGITGVASWTTPDAWPTAAPV